MINDSTQQSKSNLQGRYLQIFRLMFTFLHLFLSFQSLNTSITFYGGFIAYAILLTLAADNPIISFLLVIVFNIACYIIIPNTASNHSQNPIFYLVVCLVIIVIFTLLMCLTKHTDKGRQDLKNISPFGIIPILPTFLLCLSIFYNIQRNYEKLSQIPILTMILFSLIILFIGVLNIIKIYSPSLLANLDYTIFVSTLVAALMLSSINL